MEKLIYSTNIFRWHIYAYLYTIWKVEAREGMNTIRLEEKHKTTKSAFLKVIFGVRKKKGLHQYVSQSWDVYLKCRFQISGMDPAPKFPAMDPF